MPVWEIKEPLGVTPPAIKPRKRKVVSVIPITGIRAVDRLFARQDRGKGSEKRRKQEVKDKATIRKIRMLVEQVNTHLTDRGILIHLGISVIGDEWGLDIYDCSDKQQCLIIHEAALDLDELSELLNSLQREAGIMLDRVL